MSRKHFILIAQAIRNNIPVSEMRHFLDDAFWGMAVILVLSLSFSCPFPVLFLSFSCPSNRRARSHLRL